MRETVRGDLVTGLMGLRIVIGLFGGIVAGWVGMLVGRWIAVALAS